MLTHIVVLRLTPDADPGALVARVLTMRGNVPSLLGLEAGVNAVADARAWDLGVLARFEDAAALAAYHADEFHSDVKAALAPFIAEAASVDFAGSDPRHSGNRK
jgi:hypothetical protein